MRDGETRKLAASERNGGFDAFRDRWEASLVIVAGGAEGDEVTLDRPCVTLGRGPGVDSAFPDDAMSREHAAVEFSEEGFRVRDLGSTNGTMLNGSTVGAADLAHGDRIQVGQHVFQLVLEKRERSPRTYLIPES